MGRITVDRQLRLVCAQLCLLGLLLAGCARTRAVVRDPVEQNNQPVVERSGPSNSNSERAPVQLTAAREQPQNIAADRSPPSGPVIHSAVAEPPRIGPVDAVPTPLPPLAPSPSPSTGLAPPVQAAPEVIQVPASRPMTLNEAIALAFQRQPRLKVYLEGIQQAEGLSEIAFAPFLPAVATGYSVGGYALNAGGFTVTPGPIPGFTFVPGLGALPFGLDTKTGYELAEMKMQWLICDFGKRMGRYNASKIGVDIRQLQSNRAFQTVANEVTLAYYNVLRAQAMLRIAQEAVLRDEDELDVARKFAQQTAIEREKVLRAEVKLAETRRLKDLSEEALGIALAALNLAIGQQFNEPIQVLEPTAIPEFVLSLPNCLQAAVNQRREFQVARRTIQLAQEGSRMAKADFAPRIVGEGALFDLQQSSPRGHADLALGFIKLEWAIFEGGKRVGEQHVADSKIREAMAETQAIADTIAYQVNETYRRMATARLGIQRAHPAVEQATENYRLVRARAVAGDATPAEIADAETALTRAQQNYLHSIYDYLSAIAKLDYAMGTSPMVP